MSDPFSRMIAQYHPGLGACSNVGPDSIGRVTIEPKSIHGAASSTFMVSVPNLIFNHISKFGPVSGEEGNDVRK
jgi:hypothetical protein